MTKKTLIALILIFSAASSVCVLFAGQASRQYSIGYLNSQRTYSPDESQLANYLVQRSEILKSLPKSKTPYALRHQLKILNNKISYLENQIDRNRKVSAPEKMKAVHQAPPAKKTSAPAKKKAKPAPPRILETRPLNAAKIEPLPLAAIKKPLVPEGHEVYRFENPARAPVFDQVPLSSPQLMAIPQLAVSKPKMIEPATSVSMPSAGSAIQLRHAAVIKPNIQIASVQASPVQTPRPISATPAKIERIEPVIIPRVSEANVSSAPNVRVVSSSGNISPGTVNPLTVSPQITTASAETPPAAVVPAEPAKIISPVQTPETVVLKGTDWIAMPRGEKEMYVFSAMGALVKHDVVSMKPSYFYIRALDDTLKKNPSQQDQFLDDLFISSIYENEPDTRPSIDKIRR